jgi:hypothetical protein
MRHVGWLGLLAGLVAASLTHAQAVPPAGGGLRLDAVTLLIRHRVFHDFRDLQRVKLKREFILGDTDYTARVVEYVPDFTMDLGSHRITSRSNQPHNPAFRIIISQKGVPQDTTWALLKMPPHFARKSFFAFQIVRLDFLDGPPILADTTAAPAAMPPAPAAPPATPRDTAAGR